MPQTFTWSLASTASGGTNAVALSGPASGYYAVTRRLGPASGDRVMAGATWARGQPAAEIVLHCLRTPLGLYVPDPTYGLRYGAFQRATPNAGARMDAAIRAALARFIPDTITGLKNTITVVGTQALVDVSFVDPRAPDTAVKLIGRGLN